MGKIGEIIPDRLDSNNNGIQREYPKELIITIHSEAKPKLGNIISTIRQHVIYSESMALTPHIHISFCIEKEHEEDIYDSKFIALAEYIYNLITNYKNIEIVCSARCVIPASISYLMVLPIPFYITEFYHRFSPDMEALSKFSNNNITSVNQLEKKFLLENNFITLMQ